MSITRRRFAKAALALPGLLLARNHGLAADRPASGARLTGDFRGGCCVFEAIRSGVLVCRPATASNVTGNLWYSFCARLDGAAGRQPVELHWPPNNPARANEEYGGNDNFATALDLVLNASDDMRHWQPIEGVEVEGQRARFDVDAGHDGRPRWIAVGLPYFARDLEELIDNDCRKSPLAEVRTAAHTAGGRPVHTVRINAKDPRVPAFYLQGMQHATEWAGAHIITAIIRHLLSDAGATVRRKFAFHLTPVMNVDSLYGQGVAGNMNRDWRDFKMAETRGIRDYLGQLKAAGTPLLHAIDMHMGWSKRRSSGASLTAARPGAAPAELVAQQERFAKYAFTQCDWTTESIWRPQHPTGRSFASWMVEDQGIPGQTAEFSRHTIWDRASKTWSRVTQDRQQRLAVQLIEALCSFYARQQ